MKRAPRTGTIEPRGGAFRVRIREGGRRIDLGTFESRELAESELRGHVALAVEGELVPARTLRAYGAEWLDRRERRGHRNDRTDRSRWTNHILRARFADWPLEDIGRRDVRAWVDELHATRALGRGARRPLSWQSVKHAVNLLSSCLRSALDDELVERNVAADIRIERPASADPGWTYLLPAEQHALLTCDKIPRHDRMIIAFALGTGLRQGELYALELRDLHLDDERPFVFVRWGKPGLPPKNGRPRRVDLSPLALAAAREWVAGLERYLTSPGGKRLPNEHALVFPALRGGRRRETKPLRAWAAYLVAAGLAPEKRHDGRGVRWHDLRHSCATSLVAGWWGRSWRLEEVREVLGHSSVTTTERYAHLAPSVLAAAAGATPGPNLAPRALPIAQIPGRATVDSNHWPSAPEIAEEPKAIGHVPSLRDLLGAARDTAAAYLRALEGRSRYAHRLGVAHLEASERLRIAVEAMLAERERGAA